MSYTALAALAVIGAVSVDQWVLRTRLLRTRSFWASYAILLFFQLITNGVLTGLHIVRYSPAAILGVRLAYAPVEDLAFGFALITFTLCCWAWLTARAATPRRPQDMKNAMTEPGSRARARLRPDAGAGGIAAIIAAACYSSFLLSAWTHASRLTSGGFISELEAPGQPYAWFYRCTDIAAGLGMLTAAWALSALIAGRRWSAAAVVLLALTGAGSVLDGATSMRCDPGISAQCARGEHTASGLIGQLSALHTDSGLLGFAASAAGAIVLGAVLAGGWKSWGRLHILLGVSIAGCGIADLVLLLTGGGIGTAERARVLLTSAWLLTVGAFLLRRPAARELPRYPLPARRPQHVSMSTGRNGGAV